MKKFKVVIFGKNPDDVDKTSVVKADQLAIKEGFAIFSDWDGKLIKLINSRTIKSITPEVG